MFGTTLLHRRHSRHLLIMTPDVLFNGSAGRHKTYHHDRIVPACTTRTQLQQGTDTKTFCLSIHKGHDDFIARTDKIHTFNFLTNSFILSRNQYLRKKHTSPINWNP